MPEVSIEHKRIRVGDVSRSLLSGEIHYWRHDPDQWRPILASIKALELDVISTYVCWDFHETGLDQFDFVGKSAPRRNLVRFLEMAAEEDLWLLLRPGPYIYAEWVNNGVPDRVAHLHRLHADFMAAAEAYMRAVVDVVRPFLASNGGPVVLFQADNEPEPWVRFYGSQIGLGTQAGLFQEFLRHYYQDDLAALNDRWETRLADFDNARAVMIPHFNEQAYNNRYLDYRRFIYWYSTKIGHWAAETYRALGVDVPVYLNFYPLMAVQNWRELDATGNTAGPDYYSHNEFRRDSWEHQEFLHLLRYTRTFAALPVIPEFQAGIWHGWHDISGILSPRHYRMAAISALLAGIAGWNWYMLVNRDNWYMAPINEWGRTRPELYAVFAQMVALFREVDPPSLEKVTELAVGLDVLDRSAEIGGFSDPVVTALYAADLDYECYDLATGEIPKRVLFYSGHRWMNASQQDRLLGYVENGGSLVLFDQLPVYDDAMRPLNRLGLVQPDGILDGGNVTMHLGRHNLETSTGMLFHYSRVPGEPICAERLLDSRYAADEQRIQFHLRIGEGVITGYHERRGLGRIIVLGVTPSPELMRAVCGWLGAPAASRARTTNISTGLFRQGETFYLFAVNNGSEDQHTRVDLHAGLFQAARYEMVDLITRERETVDIRQRGFVTARVPAKDGTVLRMMPGTSP